MEISILTSSCTLVPAIFFDPSKARESLAEVVKLEEDSDVSYLEVPNFEAVLIYSPNGSEKVIRENISGGEGPIPEMFLVLRDLTLCREYNKILFTWQDGILFLAIAQGHNLLLANCYAANDFTTAQYWIFLAMKSLQLNPEVSTICSRLPLDADNEMSLYRYFKAVDCICA